MQRPDGERTFDRQEVAELIRSVCKHDVVMIHWSGTLDAEDNGPEFYAFPTAGEVMKFLERRYGATSSTELDRDKTQGSEVFVTLHDGELIVKLHNRQGDAHYYQFATRGAYECIKAMIQVRAIPYKTWCKNNHQ